MPSKKAAATLVEVGEEMMLDDDGEEEREVSPLHEIPFKVPSYITMKVFLLDVELNTVIV